MSKQKFLLACCKPKDASAKARNKIRRGKMFGRGGRGRRDSNSNRGLHRFTKFQGSNLPDSNQRKELQHPHSSEFDILASHSKPISHETTTMMAIVVAGGTGDFGRLVREALEEAGKYEVYVMSRKV